MLIIRDASAMALVPIPVSIKLLLRLRWDQLDHPGAAEFIVIEPPDTMSAIEAALGFTILDAESGAPCWEWIDYQPEASVYEAPFIFSDDGFATVLLVPNEPSTDEALLTLCP